MNEFPTVKAVFAGAISALSTFLGWRGVMALIWLTVMLLDYISGSVAAVKAGQWSSQAARQGIWHKCGMILVVVVGGLADLVMWMICRNVACDVVNITWPVLVLPLVLAWYIITELGSILENAVKLGANVPKWLVNLLKSSLNAVDSVYEEQIGDG